MAAPPLSPEPDCPTLMSTTHHTPAHLVSSDEIRTRFSRAMSEMYRTEVPQYGTLVELVADINTQVLQADPALQAQMVHSGELPRLDVITDCP